MIELLAAASLGPVHLELSPRGGLSVSVHEVPLVRGTSFQVYEPGWVKGYYSSNSRLARVDRDGDGSYAAEFGREHPLVAARKRVSPTAKGLRVDYEFEWFGSRPVQLQVAVALFWAPAFENGAVWAGDRPVLPLVARRSPEASFSQRVVGGPASRFVLHSRLARFVVDVSRSDAILVDARGLTEPWAFGRELLWLGIPAAPVSRGNPVRFSVDWTVAPAALPSGPELRTVFVAPRPLPTALHAGTRSCLSPVDGPFPRPKRFAPGIGPPLDVSCGFVFDLPSGWERLGEAFLSDLRRAWIVEPAPGPKVRIEARFEDLGRPEAFRFDIRERRVEIRAHDPAGLRHALRALAQVVRNEGGRLVLRPCTVEDWPVTPWRGVHLHVGPDAVPLQRRLIERVLGPLRFTHAVLQCERTAWRSLPGLSGEGLMAREDLEELFAAYREAGIEPVPLIQSLGSMGWLLASDAYLPLALDPDSRWAIDPRRREAREVITRVWDEAFEALEPRIVHFGLDEAFNRVPGLDPFLATRLFEQQVRVLTEWASRKGVRPIIWGDMALAPREAPDATNGIDPWHAAARRRAIPPGTLVADWHYVDRADPEIYRSLRLWKEAGAVPIAASWYRPNNVRGHTLAAIREGVGTLQTVWAGHVFSPASFVSGFGQYASWVLAADYAWTGRTERISELEYRPDVVLARMLYGRPASPRPLGGHAWSIGAERGPRRIGDVEFLLHDPLPLYEALSPEGSRHPHELELRTGLFAREVALVLDAMAWADEGQPLAEVIVDTAAGEVREVLNYGTHLRTFRDERALIQAERDGGYCAVRIVLPERTRIDRVRVRSSNPAVGVRLHAVTSW